MPTTIGGYENLLISMIEKRTGAEFDEFLIPQVSACAQTWMMMNRVYRDLMKAKEQSISVWRDKLGLSNTVNPERIKQDAKRGVDTEKDGLSNLLTQARDTMNEIPEMD